MSGDANFWARLDQLVAASEVCIDRPAGTAHPRYPEFLYPLDYGYLEDTAAMDGGGIDVWRCSLPDGRVVGVICTVNLDKRDSEIKVLLGCTPDEIDLAVATHNTGMQAGLLITRPDGM
jgi:inorganic pyrophosphatase